MRQILALVVFVSLLFAFGCLQKEQAGAPSANEAQEEQPAAVKAAVPCANAVGVQARDECFMGLARAGSDVKMCGRMYSAKMADECLMEVGKGITCSQLLLSQDRDGCFYALAKKENSTNACGHIASVQMQQQCIKELAPPCSLETGAAAKGKCLAYLNNDFSYCTDDACRYAYGTGKKSAGACEQMAQGAQKWACMAIAMNESGRCDNGNTQQVRDLCTEIVAVHTNNVATCARAQQGSDYRNGCYAQLAINNLNYSICGLAYPETSRDQCYMEYAQNTGFFDVCTQVVNTLNREGCYILTAKANNNPLSCGGLMMGSTRDQCYGAVILSGAKIALAYCENIGDSNWKDKCYSRMAPLYDDKALCEKVVGGDEKKNCLANFRLG